MEHKPVLLEEVIGFLDPKPGEFFIDGTLNGGGHTLEILKKISPDGILLGIDWDKEALSKFNVKCQMSDVKSKVILINDNFKNLPMILKSKKLGKADGLILDLGFSWVL